MHRMACPELRDRLTVLSVEPDRGPVEGGIEIEITGEHIDDQTTAEVGGLACEILERTSSSVICLLPQGHRFRPVVGVTLASGGEVATLPDAFRYSLPAFTDVTSAALLGAPSWGAGVLLFDANGDSRLDILYSVAASLQRGPLLYENLGGLQFRDATTPAMRTSIIAVGSVLAADFNNDGLTDVFAGNHGNEARSVAMISTGPGAFEPTFSSVVVSPPRAVAAASAADINADGFLDVVSCRAANEESGRRLTDVRLFVGINEGGVIRDDNTFVERDAAPQNDCSHTAIGDLDRDGDPDVVGCRGELQVFLFDRGVFRDANDAVLDSDELGFTCSAIHLVDVDADGDLDISLMRSGELSRGSRGGIHLFENRWHPEGELRFAPFGEVAQDHSAACTGQGQPGATLALGLRNGVWLDREMDGDLDLVLPMPTGYCVDSAIWYENQSVPGSLSFVARRMELRQFPGSLTGGAVGDLDGDGDLDVVTSEWGEHRGRAIIRNNAAENDELGRYLRVVPISDPDGDATDDNTGDDRPQPGVTVELDPDGSDFDLGNLQTRSIGATGHRSNGPVEVWFGLGDRTEPVWVQTHFPDGSLVRKRVDTFDRLVELRDCGEALCE